jgi:hypothetical protein
MEHANIKIIAGFLIIIVSSVIQMTVTYYLQGQILNDSRQIKDIEAPLDTISEKIIGYDAILTGHVQDALLHALRGQYDAVPEHKAAYDAVAVLLDDDLKINGRMLVGQSKRPADMKERVYGYLQKLDELNIKLVDLEAKAFAALEKKDADAAYGFVVGGEYDRYKKELYDTSGDGTGSCAYSRDFRAVD